jgi:hypothetical protein
VQDQISRLVRDITADTESLQSATQPSRSDKQTAFPWLKGTGTVSDASSSVTLPSLGPPKPLPAHQPAGWRSAPSYTPVNLHVGSSTSTARAPGTQQQAGLQGQRSAPESATHWRQQHRQARRSNSTLASSHSSHASGGPAHAVQIATAAASQWPATDRSGSAAMSLEPMWPIGADQSGSSRTQLYGTSQSSALYNTNSTSDSECHNSSQPARGSPGAAAGMPNVQDTSTSGPGRDSDTDWSWSNQPPYSNALQGSALAFHQLDTSAADTQALQPGRSSNELPHSHWRSRASASGTGDAANQYAAASSSDWRMAGAAAHAQRTQTSQVNSTAHFSADAGGPAPGTGQGATPGRDSHQSSAGSPAVTPLSRAEVERAYDDERIALGSLLSGGAPCAQLASSRAEQAGQASAWLGSPMTPTDTSFGGGEGSCSGTPASQLRDLEAVLENSSFWKS